MTTATRTTAVKNPPVNLTTSAGVQQNDGALTTDSTGYEPATPLLAWGYGLTSMDVPLPWTTDQSVRMML